MKRRRGEIEGSEEVEGGDGQNVRSVAGLVIVGIVICYGY